MKQQGPFNDSLPEVPTASELTVSELEEMACRQQQQIESQRQLLAAKEQRLRFLKQHEARHQQVVAEHERLRRLRDRVHAQEQKLRKLRALRGQLDTHTKLTNATLTSDLESIRAVFSEKEKELSVAVAKVEELTKQLEELQKGRATQNAKLNQDSTFSAAAELEKLKTELIYRNKLNEQQSQRLSQQRELLAERQQEMAAVDRRISELQERLHRKRIANQQMALMNSNKQQRLTIQNKSTQQKMLPQNASENENSSKNQTNRNVNMGFLKHGASNIAAVEPYHHVPSTGDKDKSSVRTTVDMQNQRRMPPPYNYHSNNSSSNRSANVSNSGSNKNCYNNSPNDINQRNNEEMTKESKWKTGQQQQDDARRLPEFVPNKYDSKYQTLPYGTKFNLANASNKGPRRGPSEGAENTQESTKDVNGENRYRNDNCNHNNYGNDERRATGVSETHQHVVHSVPIQPNNSKCLGAPLSSIAQMTKTSVVSVAARPQEAVSSYTMPVRGPPTGIATSCNISIASTNVHQKPISSVSPIYQTSSTRVQPVQPQVLSSLNNASRDIRKSENTQEQHHGIQTGGAQTPKPALPPKFAAPAKATPPPPPRQSAFHSQYVAQNDQNRQDWKQYSIQQNEGRQNTLEFQMASLQIRSNASTRNDQKISRKLDMPDDFSSNRPKEPDVPQKLDTPPPLPSVEPPFDEEVDRHLKMRTIVVQTKSALYNNEAMARHHQFAYSGRSDCNQDSSSSDTSSSTDNYFTTTKRMEVSSSYPFLQNDPSSHELAPASDKGQDNSDDADSRSMTSSSKEQTEISEMDKNSESSSTPDSEDTDKTNKGTDSSDDSMKGLKKGNLKRNNGNNHKRRVSFDPLALLLDASLEGELELVIRTASQVKNPSAANDEGITALHNAICAGHVDIVKFLVQFGCDVNAQDSDGWTPLHCAASCNNLAMVRFLVEHGACIFATTLSDQETAAEKCEEDEEGFDGCSEYLYSVQEKLGILNNGVVYAVFDYEAHNPDELSFREGDKLTVLRKGDEWEREWWWSRLDDKEGYAPRNLLGLYPRIHPARTQD